MAYIAAILCAVGIIVLLYLLQLAHTLSRTPSEALNLSPRRWTNQEILAAYEQVALEPLDVRPFLPPATGRRYVITGSSGQLYFSYLTLSPMAHADYMRAGLVGGWILRHLLTRGEDPGAIRLLDRREQQSHKDLEPVIFCHVDIRDSESLEAAFTTPWPPHVKHLPLTVVHTAAIIDCHNRADDLLPAISEVNIAGTSKVIVAAKRAGASVFTATSSASISARPPKWFPPPWRLQPDGFFQFIENAQPTLDADDEASAFRTGCIRPGNALYGTGVEDVSSITWRMLNSGGHSRFVILPCVFHQADSTSWAHNCVQNFVGVQNVSIAHLLLEAKLIGADRALVGGQAYAITDPGPPITYGDLYSMLSLLANTTTRFPSIPGLPLLGLAYLVEAYVNFRRRYAGFLPPITGQLLLCQPAVFSISMVNVCYSITKAESELGYRGPFTTLHGVAADVFEWNEKHFT
nr:3 beta-hydroxysteroid dehydrogenase type 7 [Quercus suber]